VTRRLDRHCEPIHAAIESMNGAHFVHDRLELSGLARLRGRWAWRETSRRNRRATVGLVCSVLGVAAVVVVFLSGRSSSVRHRIGESAVIHARKLGSAGNRRLGSRRPRGRVYRVSGCRTDGLEVETRELGARADAELPEDVAEVCGDRARAEEELRCDVAVA
jgi:hypothetical protein